MSLYACRDCGLPVSLWARPKTGGTYWKHSAGWHSKPKRAGCPGALPRLAEPLTEAQAGTLHHLAHAAAQDGGRGRWTPVRQWDRRVLDALVQRGLADERVDGIVKATSRGVEVSEFLKRHG